MCGKILKKRPKSVFRDEKPEMAGEAGKEAAKSKPIHK